MCKNKFMRTFLVILFVISSHLLSAAYASSITWNSYSNAAFTQAKSQHRLVLVFVKSNSCQWCKKEENTTFTNSAVSTLINANYIPVKLDTDKQSDIAKFYNITGLPTILILDADKNIINTISGYLPPEELLKHLKTTQ